MTTIILNAESVNALFPEGTEARVALQNTVLKQLVAQYIKDPAALTATTKHITTAVTQAQNEALAAMGIRAKNYSGYEITAAAKAMISEATEKSVSALIHTTVQTLDTSSEIARQVDDAVARRIREGVRARLAEIQAGI
jgi:hypothetical protein